ncbi:omega-hydroxypalmitate O-feruloyl transferase-like [Telopea speciosissima]|uniref:omega-hydroxypalmitate O-feruloyl transferase-like n=1 Tax=Telopea speciosissima TaxID=54955 RepID=UPI001CC36F67|nr:omega-hydroxypalmitate O-feruloyl transferase-like [Telopea speciosissima]
MHIPVPAFSPELGHPDCTKMEQPAVEEDVPMFEEDLDEDEIPAPMPIDHPLVPQPVAPLGHPSASSSSAALEYTGDGTTWAQLFSRLESMERTMEQGFSHLSGRMSAMETQNSYMESVEKKENFLVIKSAPVLVPPASKTNEGLFFLSNIDQYQCFILSTVYCYKPTTRSSDNVFEVIKQALAEVLVHYYPLAGKLALDSDGRFVIECTGDGVPFIEAITTHELEALGDLTKLDFGILSQLVYTFPPTKNILEIPLVATQVTRFKCGGFALGVAINHSMADGLCAMEFISSWAEIARGLPLTILPFLDRTVLKSRKTPKIEFPHHEFYQIKDMPKTIIASQDEDFLSKSFCFNMERLEQLKRSAMEDGLLEKCSSFAVVAAYTWSIMTESLQMETDEKTKLVFPIDLRSKFNPPLPKGYFGNGIFHASCLCSAGELTSKPLSFAVKLVQDSIKLVTEDYVRSALDYYEVNRTSPMATYTLFLSSWSKLDFLTADFGWGNPNQITLGNPGPNLCFILPQEEGKKDMNILVVTKSSLMTAFEETIQL